MADTPGSWVKAKPGQQSSHVLLCPHTAQGKACITPPNTPPLSMPALCQMSYKYLMWSGDVRVVREQGQTEILEGESVNSHSYLSMHCIALLPLNAIHWEVAILHTFPQISKCDRLWHTFPSVFIQPFNQQHSRTAQWNILQKPHAAKKEKKKMSSLEVFFLLNHYFFLVFGAISVNFIVQM